VRRLWGALLVIVSVAALPLAVDRAASSAFRAHPSVVFSAGVVDIGAEPSTAGIGLGNMAPGDAVTGVVRVVNRGGVPARYAMTTSVAGDDALGTELVLSIRSGVTRCTRDGFLLDGVALYDGPLARGAIGSAAPGADRGDRTLPSSSSDVLCFRVRLPLYAANPLQRSDAGASFVFLAEQAPQN